MFRCEEQQKFHTKGFIFHHKDKTTAIIGSSNLTQDALSSTKEWNVRLVSKKDGEFISSLEHEFNELWNCSQSHDLEKVLDDYTVEYEKKEKGRTYSSRIAEKFWKCWAYDSALSKHNAEAFH